MTSSFAAASAPLVYPFALGLVAAVNPCGFPLLPAYVAIFVREDVAAGRIRRTARGLAAGTGVTAGFVIVFAVVGLLVESGIHLVMTWVPWVMIAVAAGMTLYGVLAALGRQPYLRMPALRATGSGGALATVAFGVMYAVGSLSCALPLFLAGVAGSFTRLGIVRGISTFIAYALGMGVLLIAVSLIVAHAGVPAIRRLRLLGRAVPRVSGIVLTLVGAYLLLYWVSDLVAPTAISAPVRLVESVQSAVSSWLASSPREIGAVLGIVAVVALTVVAAGIRQPRSGDFAGTQQLSDNDQQIVDREEKGDGSQAGGQ